MTQITSGESGNIVLSYMMLVIRYVLGSILDNEVQG